MDALGSYLAAEMIKALGDGNLPKVLAYLAIFFLLWVQLRGLKKQLAKLNATITQSNLTFAKSLGEGEARFEKLEHFQSNLDHRMTVVELKLKGDT